MPHAPGLRRFTAAIGADLSDSLLRSGVPGVAARDYVTQMLRVANLATELSVDDRFDLIVASTPGEPPVLVYDGMDRVGRGDGNSSNMGMTGGGSNGSTRAGSNGARAAASCFPSAGA